MDAAVNRIVRLHGRYKIGGYDLRSLMDQLIKCVLAVCTRFTPNNWTSRVINLVIILKSMDDYRSWVNS